MIGLVLFSARADIVQRSKAESAVIVVFSEFFISNPFHLGHKKLIVALTLTNENQSTIGQSFLENLDFFFRLLGLIISYSIVYFGEGTPLPLDQTNKLVIAGPYCYVRNPMALAGIGQGVAGGIYCGALPILIYSLMGAIIWNFMFRPIEEKDLADRFGELCLQYQQNVRCWFPSLRHQ